MIVPGPRNLITDVAGLKVGNAQDLDILTGTTVIVADDAMTAAADVRGGGPGTRETPALDPHNLVEEIHALVLSGGSVFGLDAASAVTTELAKAGRGFKFGDQVWPCPLVPGAVLFDLVNGGNKAWGEPPYGRLGRAALANAGKDFALGNVGAGAGAIAGSIKGGLGSASAVWEGLTVGALVAVNSVGSCINGQTGRPWAIDHAVGTEMGPHGSLAAALAATMTGTKLDILAEAAKPGANTTIATVATDARLTKSEAKRLAIMAADGLAIAIRPLHTPFDGDSVFSLATGRRELEGSRPLNIARLGELAALTLARAVGRALWEASSQGLARSYRDLCGA